MCSSHDPAAVRLQHLPGVREHLPQQAGDRTRHARVFAREVREQLHAERDVALLVEGDLVHPDAERGEQLAFLESLGCKQAQGYLFGAPVPVLRKG